MMLFILLLFTKYFVFSTAKLFSFKAVWILTQGCTRFSFTFVYSAVLQKPAYQVACHRRAQPVFGCTHMVNSVYEVK